MAGVVKVRMAAVKYPQLYDKEWVIEQFITRKRSRSDVARELGCAIDTISARCHALGISLRDKGPFGQKYLETKLYEPGWLKAQLDESRTIDSIAKEIGCAKGTVKRAITNIMGSDFERVDNGHGPDYRNKKRRGKREPKFAIRPTSPLAQNPLFSEFVKREA